MAAALLCDSGAQADAEPAASQGISAPPRKALLLPAPAPSAHSQFGATTLTPAAYRKLFMHIPMLQQLTAVSLQGQQLGNEGVLAATMGLQMHVHLQHFDVRGNKLDSFGVRALSGTMSRWPSLCALLLSENQLLSVDAADELAPGLHTLAQLTWLDVRSTRMTDALRAALAMQRLELGTPRVGEALTHMVHLSHLDLGLPAQQSEHHDQKLSDAAEQVRLVERLRVHTALRWLSLAHACDDLSVFEFQQWPLLRHVDVGGLAAGWFSGGGEDSDEEPEYHVLQGDAPTPPDSNRSKALHSIACLSHLTSLRTGCEEVSSAFPDALSRVLAALPSLH
jgi:hypothetical protein